MKSLQRSYRNLKSVLEKKLSPLQISGRAGRLDLSPKYPELHYRAVFVFDRDSSIRNRHFRETISKIGRIKENYGITVEYLENYSVDGIDTGRSVLYLVSEKGKPSEQEDILIKALKGISSSLD
jgi:hypothetical protein